MTSNNWFVNAVGRLETTLTPDKLLLTLQEIEKKFGRTRQKNSTEYQDRSLDLDLLLYENKVLNTPDLTIPHPLMHERIFVIQPLAEINPNLRHPVLKKSASEMLEEIQNSIENSSIYKINWVS